MSDAPSYGQPQNNPAPGYPPAQYAGSSYGTQGAPPYGQPPAMPPYGQPPAVPPYGQQQPVGYGSAGKRRNPFAAWLLLPIITLGIYSVVWLFKTNKELSQLDRRIVVNPWLSVLGVFPGCFLIIPPFIVVWRLGVRIAQAQRAAGVSESNPVISFVLYCIGFGTLYSQFEINKIWDRYPSVQQGQQIPLYR